jgi:hypothetical protein
MTPARLLAVLIGPLLLAGCYESAFPLDAAPAGAVDAKLIGAWRCLTQDPDDDALTMTFAQAREGVYAVSLKEKKEDEPETYEAYASRVGGQVFLNTRQLKESARPWVYLHQRALRSDVFQLQIVSEKAMKDVAVTATPDAVRRAIERKINDPALFEEATMTCVRASR